jgi:hypothetical protein
VIDEEDEGVVEGLLGVFGIGAVAPRDREQARAVCAVEPIGDRLGADLLLAMRGLCGGSDLALPSSLS